MEFTLFVSCIGSFLGQRHPDYTRAVIKDKLNDTDNEIATTSCKVSLACPLGNVFFGVNEFI